MSTHPHPFRHGLLVRPYIASTLMAMLCLSSTSCVDPADGDDTDTATSDGLIDAKIFQVDMRVDSFDTSSADTPQFASVASILYGTFPVDPLAVEYTVEFERMDVEGQDIAGSWLQGEPIAEVFALGAGAVEANFWAGYDGGISGGEYYVRLTSSGCQSGADGECQIGTESTLATESTLRDVRQQSTLTVTISYE